HAADHGHAGVVDAHVVQSPVVRSGPGNRAGDADHALQYAAGAFVDGHVADDEVGRTAVDDAGANEVLARKHPDVGKDAAIGRDRLVVVVRPGVDHARGVDDHGLVEGEQAGRDDDAGDDERG